MAGSLVAWKGARDEDEERAGRRRGRALGLEPAEVPSRSSRIAGAEHRHLHLYAKVGPDAGPLPAPAGHGAQAARWDHGSAASRRYGP